MAIVCPRCGAAYDVTLFQFGRRIHCDCGAWVGLGDGHTIRAAPGSWGSIAMAEEEIGRITHYFGKIGVAAIEITHGSLAVGDTIRIKGHTSDFTQPVNSMQIDGKTVDTATAGQSIGLRVAGHAREHDAVFKVAE